MLTQERFVKGLLNPNIAVPEGLIDASGNIAVRRYGVYRNNVTISLIEAMETNFPILRLILGEERFRAISANFIRSNPPQSPIMMTYGALFPEFLKQTALIQKYPYLPDMAHIELALRAAYHAADVEALSPSVLSQIPEAELSHLRFIFVPAFKLLRSHWPVFDHWRVHHEADSAFPQQGGQNLIIVRPEYDPYPVLLPAGGGVFVQSLLSGNTLNTAFGETLDKVEDFDLGAILGLLLQNRALQQLT